MPNPTTAILGHPWQTYTLTLMIVLIGSVAWGVWRAPQGKRAATFDVCLGGVIGGVLVGRAVHVALWWAYFQQNTAQIWQLSDGSVDWRGALIGALVGAWGLSRWRSADVAWLARQAAWFVPLLATAGWWACAAGRCAYGAAVPFMSDYPPGMTWDAPDIYNVIEPRFAVQPMGAALSLIVWALMLLALRRDWFPRWRVGLALIMVSLISFGLGFLRGDTMPVWGALRADQWLDAGVALLGMGWIVFGIRRTKADQTAGCGQ